MVRDSFNEPSALLAALLSRSKVLRAFVEARIPRRLSRTVSADDILQNVWVTVVQSVGDINSLGWAEFDPWLMRTAQRRIADAIRRANALKRRGRNSILCGKQTASYADLFAHVRSPQNTPSKEMSQQEAAHATQIALAALPEHYRTALTLRFIHGSSHDQIAEAMCKSRSAVNSLLFRGLRRLRGLMGSADLFFSDDGTPVAARSVT